MTTLALPNSIDIVEAKLRTMADYFGEAVIPLTHRFVTGIYARQVDIPAGTMCVGKVHKQQHFTVVLSGDCTIYDDMDGVRRIVGPIVMIAEPGVQRVVFANTDSSWITFHASEETDLERLEWQLIEKHDNPLLHPELEDMRHKWLENAMRMIQEGGEL